MLESHLFIRVMLRRFVDAATAAGILALAVCATGHCAPLPADTVSTPGFAAAHRVSDADLVLSDPRLGAGGDAPQPSPRAEILGLQGVRSAATSTNRAAPGFDYGQGFDPDSGGSLHESGRSIVNVQRASGSAPPAPARQARATRNDELSLDLGITSNEWIRDSLKEVLASVLNTSVNERGQTSFSVLGLGEFSIVVSRDRSEIAMTSGDDILVTARRPVVSAAAGGSGGGYADPHWGFGGFPGAGGGSGYMVGDSPLRRALQLAIEIATHPLTFIVYALIAGYALIWMLLSGRKSRQRRRPALANYRPRAHAAAEPIPPMPVVKARKRIRVRRHRHRGKPSVHRS